MPAAPESTKYLLAWLIWNSRLKALSYLAPSQVLLGSFVMHDMRGIFKGLCQELSEHLIVFMFSAASVYVKLQM